MSESSEAFVRNSGKGAIQRQITLPLSKAVEISLKSLRVRFWRSMLTVSSIILAIAFLTFVWASSRVNSAVAVGMRPDSLEARELSDDVEDVWKLYQPQLAKRFSENAGAYKKARALLVKGDTTGFKKFCHKNKNDAKPDSAAYKRLVDAKKADLRLLPFDAKGFEVLAERARKIGLSPDVEDWPVDSLKLAGLKGVVQKEVNRFSALQLAVRNRDLDPDMTIEQLKRMSPTSVWLIIISLMVCGVGITNAMLMSVTERFREIGTMKCLGALDGFIVKLFLLESTFQGVSGTLFGVVIGFVIMILASWATFGVATWDYLPIGQVLLILLWGLLIGSALSILAAVFPALRAAHMAPVEAMRVDE